jgi:hypothetical protein
MLTLFQVVTSMGAGSRINLELESQHQVAADDVVNATAVSDACPFSQAVSAVTTSAKKHLVGHNWGATSHSQGRTSCPVDVTHKSVLLRLRTKKGGMCSACAPKNASKLLSCTYLMQIYLECKIKKFVGSVCQLHLVRRRNNPAPPERNPSLVHPFRTVKALS